MELEVGMYVRLNCNYELGIGKTIREIDEDNFIKTKFKDDFECSIPTYMITKASHNIKELLQVGDIITYEFPTGLGMLKYENVTILEDLLDVLKSSDEYEILSIVTKEQIEIMSYKVGE